MEKTKSLSKSQGVDNKDHIIGRITVGPSNIMGKLAFKVEDSIYVPIFKYTNENCPIGKVGLKFYGEALKSLTEIEFSVFDSKNAATIDEAIDMICLLIKNENDVVIKEINENDFTFKPKTITTGDHIIGRITVGPDKFIGKYAIKVEDSIYVPIFKLVDERFKWDGQSYSNTDLKIELIDDEKYDTFTKAIINIESLVKNDEDGLVIYPA